MMVSERQKMEAGDWYSCLDDELEALRMVALNAVHAHNHLPPSERRALSAPLCGLFADPGTNCLVEVPFHCSYGRNIHLGTEVFINSGCVILDSAPVHIGHGTMIGTGVQILCADHHRDPAKRRAGIEIARPVTIGANVWIGAGAIVMPGVTIEAEAIVGAGAVVTRDVSQGATVVGIPAKPVQGGGPPTIDP
ncbi:sugar O-acetyltransferase [Tateyamaria omphalii]|uniref:sugar O-acetyltransferase n=1 Tax=Tateyamaria omphalii TaxID=299262 RepID=UPI001C9A078C|nr:sugar O-acetyltransferase [Tateyamaria omphalii]MBY5932380.1 sugar O-acetyltransferase [Tateyamaria omphalii]